MEFLFLPELRPFAISLALLVGLVGLEALVLVLGLGLTGVIDDALPDVDADAPDASGFEKALGFVGVGKVPAMVVLMSFLATFGVFGALVQTAAVSLAGVFLPKMASIPVAGALALLATGRTAALIARILPAEETSAVGADSLIGRTAVITYGESSHERPASARVVDVNGGVHVVQVLPASPSDIFVEGEEPVIVSRSNGFYLVASPERTALPHGGESQVPNQGVSLNVV